MLSIVKRLCIFCGERPTSKTMEHVIPQWLINLTGDPKRKVFLGMNLSSKQEIRFSFDSLKFPACDSCNNRFSGLEGEVKEIVIKLLSQQPLTADSFHILLSWFDKVRVGLFLGLNTLKGDIIEPNYYIESRTNKSDRMVLIYKTSNKSQGINVLGVNSPLFSRFPSFMGIRINNYYFLNIATFFLFSRRLGLPHPKEVIYLEERKQFQFTITKGEEFIRIPIIRRFHNRGCTEIYQPIHPTGEAIRNNKGHIYINEYVNEYLDIPTGIGRILISKNNKRIERYPNVPSKMWIPDKCFSAEELLAMCHKDIVFFQNLLMDTYSIVKNRPTEIIKNHDGLIKLTKIFNRRLLNMIEKDPLSVFPKKGITRLP